MFIVTMTIENTEFYFNGDHWVQDEADTWEFNAFEDAAEAMSNDCIKAV